MPVWAYYARIVIDLHSHILPGLDDGAVDVDAAVAIARAMVADGIRTVAGTPHVRDDYPTTPDAMLEALESVRDAVAGAGIDLHVLGGAEIALAQLDTMDAATLERFGLGGNPRLVLLEYPYYGVPHGLPARCTRLLETGIVPVIAHPERNEMVQARPADLEGVVGAGAFVQLTAASLAGRLGRAAADCARRLLDLEYAHLVASDAHSPTLRGGGMSAAAEAVGTGDLAIWLTTSVPEALLAGEDLPRRPPGSARGRRLRARFRR
jgi:protein-tyrosine phosphatase